MKRGILQNFETNRNFWEANPQFKTIDVFAKFRERDRSARKFKSSKIMWGVAFLLDPSDDNIYRNLPYDKRKEVIGANWLKGEEFKWSNHRDILKCFSELVLTHAQRALIDWNDKIIERGEFLKKTKYSLDNAEKLDKMMGNTEKIFKQYKQIEEELQKEIDSSKTKGGAEESASEKGEI